MPRVRWSGGTSKSSSACRLPIWTRFTTSHRRTKKRIRFLAGLASSATIVEIRGRRGQPYRCSRRLELLCLWKKDELTYYASSLAMEETPCSPYARIPNSHRSGIASALRMQCDWHGAGDCMWKSHYVFTISSATLIRSWHFASFSVPNHSAGVVFHAYRQQLEVRHPSR